jgi:predicted DNA-binding transcriptional regulator AlpA
MPAETNEDDDILSLKAVSQITNLSRSTIWREQKAGRFPRSVKLSPGRVGCFRGDVRAWLKARGR